MTATTTTTLVPILSVFSDAEWLALAGFLAGYRGLTREAYALDLRQFTTWCRACSLNLFSLRRADIEGSPATWKHVAAPVPPSPGGCAPSADFTSTGRRRPAGAFPGGPRPAAAAGHESRAVALDRNELGALLVAAGLGPPVEHALMSLLALNGLRVSEATGADIEHLGLDRGHRTLTITRKGGKVVTIPLAPRTARAIDLAISERTGGPVFQAADGRRLDRHGAGRIVRKVARRAGITKAVTPHTLRHAFITERSGTARCPP
jgi:integrase/recombinase XerD